MAIVQDEATLVAMGNSVGILDERAEDIKALEATVTDEATLEAVCNQVGLYDENAERLIAAGVTFV